MKPESSRALSWLAGILLIVGLMAASPAAQFMLFAVSGMAAVAPALSALRSIRITGCILLLLSVMLAVTVFPQFRKSQNKYVERVRQHSPAAPYPLPQK